MELGKVLRSWGPAVLLAVFAFGAYRAAVRRDTDVVSPERVVYEQSLLTPMLSARRVPLTLQAPIVDDQLRPVLQDMINASPPASCLQVQVGNRVIDPSLNPAVGLLPASNQKLFTTYAGLELLSPDFAFNTTVRGSLPVDAGGVIEGNLYLIGDGDPYLSTVEWWEQYSELDGRFHTSLEELADRVFEAGVRTVTGDLVGDESRYDSLRQGPWAERIFVQRQSGPLSALTVNEGFVDWPSADNGLGRSRSPTDDPPRQAASTFLQLLTERGITVEGEVGVGTTPADAEAVAAISSPPLTDIVTHINSYSSNIGAELLLKRIGLHGAGEGSTVAGAGVLFNLLQTNGIPTRGMVLDDGSGLADSNKVTCEALAAVLSVSGPDSPFAHSLAIGGRRGSLLRRFVDTKVEGNVLAKTGTLNDSTALSGFVRSSNDETWLTFAYVANDDLIIADTEIKDLQDPFVIALGNYPGRPLVSDLAPIDPVPTG